MRISKSSIGLAVVLLAGAAHAHIFDFQFSMRGENVVPPTDSQARGTGLLEYNHHTFNYSLDLFVTGISLDDLLDTGPNGSPLHMYHAPRGEVGDIMVDPGHFGDFVDYGDGIRFTVTDLRLGGDQGAFQSSIFEAEDALYDGHLYIQLYTTRYPDGEIRGQFPPLGKGKLLGLDPERGVSFIGDPIPLPAPATIAPLAALGLLVRRRR